MGPNILDNEDLYKSIVLKGVSSPGQVTLSGHDSKVVWDVKSGPSLNGATIDLKARPPIEFSASFYLLRDPSQGIDDFAAWPDFAKLIESTVAGAKPQALDIYHPDLAANGIKSVVKATIGGMTYDGQGGATVVVKFQEYRPPKKQGGTPLGSQKQGPDNSNPDLKAIINNLVNQYQKTPYG
jgi:hypothetical protein